MATSGMERHIPLRINESTEQYLTQRGSYTANIWREWSGLWTAVVTGPDGASVCHGLLSREDAQAWSRAQAGAFAARAEAEACAR